MSSNSNNFNRQFSSPVQDGQSRRRQSSLTIPPRPATASPTTPSRPFCPLPSTHEERSNSGYVQGPNVPARRSSHSVTRHRPPYIEALLDNQTRQYDRLVQESRKLNSNLSTMAFTVSHLEDEVFSQPARRANYDKYLEMLELRKEIRQLKIDCHSLITEVDLFGEYPFSGAGSTMNRNLPNRVSGPNEPEGPPPLPPRPRHPRQPELDFGKLFQRVPPPKPDSHTMKHRPSFPSKTPSPKMHLNQDSYVLRSQRVHRLSEQAGNGSSSSVNYEYNGNEVYGDMTNSRTGSDNWTCLGCTFKNHHELTSCEMCELRKGSYASMEGTVVASIRKNYFSAARTLSSSALSTFERLRSFSLDNNQLFPHLTSLSVDDNANLSPLSNRRSVSPNNNRPPETPGAVNLTNHVCRFCHCHTRLQN